MARRSPPRRGKAKKIVRRGKKKVSPLTISKIEFVDYKDTDLLRKFISERAKIKARRISGNDAGQQREVARAVKNAREMALIPYTNRVTTQRRERRSDDRAPRAPTGRHRDRRLRRPAREATSRTISIPPRSIHPSSRSTSWMPTRPVSPWQPGVTGEGPTQNRR